MNRTETHNLFNRGRAAWNGWADAMSAERAELEKGGTSSVNEAWARRARADFSDHTFAEGADFSSFRFPGDALFTGARFCGRADFSGARFCGRANFSGARFNGFAQFNETRFCENAVFTQAQFAWFAPFVEAKFDGEARFHKARFSGYAEFKKAAFCGNARFEEVQFEGPADFTETCFRGNARFMKATFSGVTQFDSANFRAEADFSAISGKTVFSLYNTRFKAVPNFEQADFAQAPRVDTLRIEPWRPEFKTPNAPARWSELKRLAVQRHDHMSETGFFRGELKARRWGEHKPWHAVFWAGWAYQWFSGFGFSILRPLLWWAIGVALFAGLYGAEHADRRSARDLPPEGCLAGSGSPVAAAVVLSLKTALVVGAVPSQQAGRARECLFGIEPVPVPGAPAPGGDTRHRPVYPVKVAFLGALQFVWSAAMLFLFGLGLRNHFRVK